MLSIFMQNYKYILFNFLYYICGNIIYILYLIVISKTLYFIMYVGILLYIGRIIMFKSIKKVY